MILYLSTKNENTLSYILTSVLRYFWNNLKINEIELKIKNIEIELVDPSLQERLL